MGILKTYSKVKIILKNGVDISEKTRSEPHLEIDFFGCIYLIARQNI